MKITEGMYTTETWTEYNLDFKQFRMAVIVDDGGFSDLVTTAIVMQLDEKGKGFATKLETTRYFDGFGDSRKQFLDDRLLHDFNIYLRASEKKIEKLGGRMSTDMDVLIAKFLDHKMKFNYASTWDTVYKTMDLNRYGATA